MILSNLDHFRREFLDLAFVSCLTGQSTLGTGLSGDNEVLSKTRYVGLVINETWSGTYKWERELENYSRELMQRQKKYAVKKKYCNKIPRCSSSCLIWFYLRHSWRKKTTFILATLTFFYSEWDMKILVSALTFKSSNQPQWHSFSA